MIEAKGKTGERKVRTPEENCQKGFPLAEEFYAIALPDGRVLDSAGEWTMPLEAAAELAEGRKIKEARH